MGTGRKWIRRGVSWGGKILGGLVIASPAFKAWSDVGGDIKRFPGNAAYEYVGRDPSTGNFDVTKAIAGVGTVVTGIVIAKLFSWAARSL